MPDNPDPMLIDFVKAVARAAAKRDMLQTRKKDHDRADADLRPFLKPTSE